MKTLIVYDSLYKNTEKIAKAIGIALGRGTRVSSVTEVNTDYVKSIELLIVGSPTHGGRPTPAIEEFLSKIPPHSLIFQTDKILGHFFLEEKHGIGTESSTTNSSSGSKA